MSDAGKHGKSSPEHADIIARLERSVEKARRDSEFARSVVEAETHEKRVKTPEVQGFAASQFNSLAVTQLNSHISQVRAGNLLSRTDRIWKVAAW